MRNKFIYLLTMKLLVKGIHYFLVGMVLIFAYLHVYHMGQYSTEVIHHKYDELGEKAFKECMKQHSPDNEQCIAPDFRTAKLFLSMFK